MNRYATTENVDWKEKVSKTLSGIHMQKLCIFGYTREKREDLQKVRF